MTAAHSANPYADGAEAGVPAVVASSTTRAIVRNQAVAAAHSADPYAEGGLNTSATFGKITASGAYRNVQLAAKLHF